MQGVWGFGTFGIQLWDYNDNSTVAYWLSTSMIGVLCVDMLLRLINPQFSVFNYLTSIARSLVFPAQPYPWPPTAMIARLIWLAAAILFMNGY